MTLPAIGATVYGVLDGTPHDPRTHIIAVRVISIFSNVEGVVGAWCSVGDGWKDRAFALRDENITWTRAGDPESHQALPAAYALLHSC